MNTVVWILAVVLLTGRLAPAQSFRMRADVPPIAQSGYYRISLPPDVVGRLNRDLTDMRLYDDRQEEIPYRLTRQQPSQRRSAVDFEVVSRTREPNRNTTVVLRNKYRSQLQSITLQVKNADVSKTAQLSGSADARNWYALRDAIRLQPTAAPTRTTTRLRIDVPTSDYEYYRLVIGDSLSEPLNILRVSYDSSAVAPGAYTPIDNLFFTQRDSSDKKTYIQIFRAGRVTRGPARFDKLQLSFSTTDGFVRDAAVGQFRVYNRRRGRPERRFEISQTTTFSSGDSNVVYLPKSLTTKALYVVINNGDSPALPVRAVRAYQVSTFLTANLRAGTAYQLYFSADDVAAPQYDLTRFQSLVNSRSTTISVTNLRPVNASERPTWGVLLPRWLIWVALGLVLALLGLLTYRMLNEVEQRNDRP